MIMKQLSNIKTSLRNKEVVTELTKKLGLGTENIIARIAIGYSFSKGKKLSLSKIEDSKGKEYSKGVLFGSHSSTYIALTCVHYGISSEDNDISKYLKLHIDDGLQLLMADYKKNPGLSGLDYIISKIDKGLEPLMEETIDR